MAKRRHTGFKRVLRLGRKSISVAVVPTIQAVFGELSAVRQAEADSERDAATAVDLLAEAQLAIGEAQVASDPDTARYAVQRAQNVTRRARKAARDCAKATSELVAKSKTISEQAAALADQKAQERRQADRAFAAVASAETDMTATETRLEASVDPPAALERALEQARRRFAQAQHLANSYIERDENLVLARFAAQEASQTAERAQDRREKLAELAYNAHAPWEDSPSDVADELGSRDPVERVLRRLGTIVLWAALPTLLL